MTLSLLLKSMMKSAVPCAQATGFSNLVVCQACVPLV